MASEAGPFPPEAWRVGHGRTGKIRDKWLQWTGQRPEAGPSRAPPPPQGDAPRDKWLKCRTGKIRGKRLQWNKGTVQGYLTQEGGAPRDACPTCPEAGWTGKMRGKWLKFRTGKSREKWLK